jgi:hypothetical protein
LSWLVSLVFGQDNFPPLQPLTIFSPLENDEYRSILAAVWVTEGENRCIVGYLPEVYKDHAKLLEGRLAQVVTIFTLSKDSNKIAFSNKNEGVCHAILIDKQLSGDERLDELVTLVDSDVED